MSILHWPPPHPPTPTPSLKKKKKKPTKEKLIRLRGLCVTANRLYSSLMPLRPAGISKLQAPKPGYNKLQLPEELFYSGLQPTLEYQEMSKWTPFQRRVPEENSMPTMSASVKRRLSSERSRCQDHRGMTTTCCPGSSKSFWWGFAPNITDWTVICTANWSWHPHQPAPVVKKTKPYVLQRCPLHKATREDVWPVSTPLTTKLYGCKQELEKTTSFISRAALIV